MAVLSKTDRISMSRAIIEIPEKNAVADVVIEQIDAQKQAAIEADSLNAALQTPYNDIINKYQKEYGWIEGLGRTELTENLINAAARGEEDNGFFLANPEKPIPSVPSGVWTFFAPMSYTYAIGKTFSETYITQVGEERSINNINNIISSLGSFSISALGTGSVCVPNLNPPPAETKEPLTAVQDLMDDFKQQIQDWVTALNNQKNDIVLSDNNSTRLAQNQTAFNEIDPVINDLQNFLALDDFSTGGTCPLSEDWSSYPNVKFNPTSINTLQNIISDRESFLTTRKTQLDSYFGFITQDTSSGQLTDYSGWYGERYLIIDSRLNLISGSANGKFNTEQAIATQEQIKASNDVAAASYGLVMKATKTVAPGIDTNYINVLNSSEFSVGDRVYLVANDQEELSGGIDEIIGNRIKLTFKVPKKYTVTNKTRLYKLIQREL